jgi:hypothetical protein
MIISGWKFKRGVKELQSIELPAKELLYCVYTNASGICYPPILQLTIGSLTIDPAFLCGTICRKSEKIKSDKKERIRTLREFEIKGIREVAVTSRIKKNANISLALFLRSARN